MKTNLLNPKFMNKLSRKIMLATVGVPILGLCSLTAQAAGLTYPFLNTFDSATIDGDYGEWVPLASNVHVPMYEAGNPTKDVLSDLYLRYDCQSQTMFGLVLKQPSYDVDGAPWIKIYELSNSPQVDDGDNNLGTPTNTPPEFSWIPPSASVQANTEGYEASFSLAPGNYTMEAHINMVPGRTSSTGRGDYFVNLDLTCPNENDVLNINKTANPFYTEEYDWMITKTVDPDSHTMFIGDPAQTSTYTVTVDQTLTEGQKVTGEITITNDTASKDAIIASIIDTITPGNIPVVIDCGGVTFPYTLPAGQTLTCSYTEILTSAFDGQNEVIVVPANGSELFGGQATDDFVFDANTPIDVTGYPTVDVVDTREGVLQTDLDGDKTFTYTTDFSCSIDELPQYVNGKYVESYDNTAKIQKTEGGNTTVVDSDDANVVKTCYAPTVSKTATTSFNRQHLWSILKEVDPSELNMFINDSGQVTYTVTVDDSSFVDVDFAVQGNITVVNPNPDAPMTVNVADELEGATNLVLACGGSLTVPAGSSANCGYSAQLPNNDTRTNLAKITLNGIEFTGTTEVGFSSTPTNVLGPSPATINVSDTNGQGWTTSDADSWTYTQDFSCSGNTSLYNDGVYSYPHDNIATITETGQSDDAHVTVNCYAPVVSKTANTSFDREYNWDIEKTVAPDSLTMNIGDSGEVTYTVSVSTTPTDKNFAVTGSITVNNSHPTQPMTVTVADILPDAVNLVLDCGGSLTVPANGSANCGYSAGLPTNDTRTNTAIVTLNQVDFPGTAQVVFGDTPTNETGPTPSPINVDDTNGESWTTGEPTSWTYTKEFTCSTDTSLYVDGFYSPPNHDNTATIVETGDSDTASVTLECYAPIVSKTADTSFDRDYTWTIDKTATNVQERLILQLGQAFNVIYEIAVNASSTDSNYAVSGNIVVSNPNPEDSMSINVTDTLSNSTPATVICPATPLVIAPNGSETCTYSASLTDGTSLTNTATATLNGHSFNSNPVDVIFSDPPATETDKCIDVTDTYPEPTGQNFGQVCADAAPQTFSYTRTLQYNDPSLGQDCTDPTVVSVEVPNTASFEVSSEPSSGATGSDDELVQVCIPTEPPGCSLTQGYWKTHSKYGPAPYDDTWKVDDGYGNLIDLEDQIFFLSGQSYYDVLWTPPQGNAYYILAHQWIAAYLNTLADASMPSGVVDAWNEAQGLFELYDPAEVAKAKGKTGKELREQFVELATILDAYNNGIVGPGHCSDDSPKDIITCNGFNYPLDQFFTVMGNDTLLFEATLTNADQLPITDLEVTAPWFLLLDTSNDFVRGFLGQFTYNSMALQWERLVETGNLGDGQYRAVMMSGDSDQYLLNPTCEVRFDKAEY